MLIFNIKYNKEFIKIIIYLIIFKKLKSINVLKFNIFKKEVLKYKVYKRKLQRLLIKRMFIKLIIDKKKIRA